jgi:hypothetical protein
MSYYELYFNLKGEKSLRTYSRPVNLSRFDGINWMTSESELWPISDYLYKIPHRRILTSDQEQKRRHVDSRTFQAGLVGRV